MSLDFDTFKKTIFLGDKVSNKHPFFKEIAKLGFAEAEDYALLEVLKALYPENEQFLNAMQGMVEITGMATFLKYTAEITRLSLILGDIPKARAYGT